MADVVQLHKVPASGNVHAVPGSPTMAGPSTLAVPYPYQHPQSVTPSAPMASNQLVPMYAPSESGIFGANSQSSLAPPDGRGLCQTSPSTGYETPVCSLKPCGNNVFYSAPPAPPVGELHPLIPSKFKYSFPRNKMLRHKSYEVLAIEEGPKDPRVFDSFGRAACPADEVLGRVKKPYRKKTIFGITRHSAANHSQQSDLNVPGFSGRGAALPGRASLAWGAASRRAGRAASAGKESTQESSEKAKGWMHNFQCFLCTSADYVSTEHAALEEQNEQLDEALTEFHETNRIQAIRLFETENQLEKKNAALEQLQLQLEYETAELKKKNIELQKETKIAESSLNELRDKVVKTIETVSTFRESGDTSKLDAVLRDFCVEVANVLNAARLAGAPGPSIVIPATSLLSKGGSSKKKAVKGKKKAVKGKKKTVKGKKKAVKGKKANAGGKKKTGKKKGTKEGGARKSKASGTGAKGSKGKKAKGTSGIKKKTQPRRKPAKTVARRARVVKKRGSADLLAPGVSTPVALGYKGEIAQTPVEYLLQQQLISMQHAQGEHGVAGAKNMQFLLYPGFLEQRSLAAKMGTDRAASTASGSVEHMPQNVPEHLAALGTNLLEKQRAAGVAKPRATVKREKSSPKAKSPGNLSPAAVAAGKARTVSA
ncbi:hypothetical protein TGRUB_308860 [Toxoplasma gondii RUB]|uniref:Uncharacterized protein n=4 Tax=Toxoplasma gondii TaxID=5811 RepID=S7UT19_TOXGG|nr:hypothetical protein TGGT1_308860 [Toxoplasma gondii GT1]KAF4639084.1 hypothetical protein TGRH88_048550 [Toxoplasma gondii]KFG57731.1 hypothetical protein TGRUB_308860 [Toxoplasma gondii RUB]KFH10068.1 hypothetical protein TGVAND_308860 [Toxoplasma gondii VAND]